mgnify:CR=1 FL=1
MTAVIILPFAAVFYMYLIIEVLIMRGWLISCLVIFFIPLACLSEINVPAIQVSFQIADKSKLKKLGLWVCVRPNTPDIGKIVPLVVSSPKRITLTTDCRSFGFYPFPYHGTGAYVPPAAMGLNTLNYMRGSVCELEFNNTIYPLAYGHVITIDKKNVHPKNNASVSCRSFI